MFKVLFGTVALLCATGANAASILIVSNSSYSSNEFDVSIGDRNIFDQGSVDVDDTTVSGTSYSTDSAASGIGASASGFGSVDIDSGLIRSRTGVSLDAPSNTTGESASGNATSTLTTNVTASGSGFVTANLAIDGFWDLSRADVATTSWQAQGSLVLGAVTAQDFFVLNGGNSLNSGSIDTSLSLNFFVSDGDEFSITSTLLTQILGGTMGIVDFSNTAALTFETDSAVTLLFSDSRTLTNAPNDDDVSVVPLPAGLPLLSVALLGLGFLRRRKRA